MKPSIQTRIAVTESYLHLLRAVDECVRLHKEAGIDLPQVVSLILAEGHADEDIGEEPVILSSADPLPPPTTMFQKPSSAGEEWIRIPVAQATPTSLIVAFLGNHLGPVTAAEVVAYFKSIEQGSVVGSIYNALNRLAADGVLMRSSDGYELVLREKAGIIQGNQLWASPDVLLPPEITWHRRHAIVHALRHVGPLQVVSLVNLLNRAEWVKTKLNKDVVKLDMQALEREDFVRRVEGTRKWEIVEENESAEADS